MSTTDLKRAKEYQKTRNWLTLWNLVLTITLLSLMIALRIHEAFFSRTSGFQNIYAQLVLFFLLFSIYFLIFQLPLGFYSSYVLEHQYQLSNHTLKSWILDEIKKEVLSFVFSAALVAGLFAIIWNSPEFWWLWAWAAYLVVSIVMGKLFPVFIIPLFYKYSPLQDTALKTRLIQLSDRFGIKIENISSLNLSKNTKKANAAFTGMGKTKRIILGDTLLNHFTHDEIETVVAHEIGHYKHLDIWKQLIFGAIFSLVTFWIGFQLISFWMPEFGHQGARDLLGMPMLFLIFYLCGLAIGPASNAYSRHAERRADQFALENTRNKQAFISAMEKLSETNLADPDPHPIIEFLLYDHPAIQKRIDFAKQYA